MPMYVLRAIYAHICTFFYVFLFSFSFFLFNSIHWSNFRLSCHSSLSLSIILSRLSQKWAFVHLWYTKRKKYLCRYFSFFIFSRQLFHLSSRFDTHSTFFVIYFHSASFIGAMKKQTHCMKNNVSHLRMHLPLSSSYVRCVLFHPLTFQNHCAHVDWGTFRYHLSFTKLLVRTLKGCMMKLK